ncbi:MAG TPA: flagellar basal-body MS-ring/collar protein FliF [Steroidobacteraceae bacterium]|nr:flagellar basal-body MS-ring/collar protein FliF [Steroidobacteraceae bacterium]
MNGILEGLKALGPGRLIAMAAVAVGMLGLLAVLSLRGGGDHMALLYADLDARDAGQIDDLLTRQHITHQLGVNGAEILVPADQVARTRVLLARDNLPTGGSIGYEIFDRGDGLLSSQFEQQINQTRALEGELERTIRAINGVRAARVHLVLPRREPFARSQQEAQASVLLTMSGPGRLDREGVQAVLNLVAAAVPGLRAKNIAIIDSRGDLLARAGDADPAEQAANQAEQARREIELRLERAVEDMLAPTVGAGRVRAEASVEMDFDEVHETTEKYDPDGQVVRSTQTTSDSTKSTEAQQAATVQNNLPNADAGNPAQAGSQEQRQEETTNYEIGRTVHTLVHDHPQIRRISLAVLVDGSEQKDAKGVMRWTPRTPEELAHITALVRGAIGYDQKRGDQVEVVNMRFAAEEPEAAPASLLGIGLEKPDFVRLAQTGIVGLLGVLALLLVFRPMMARLTRLPELAGPAGDLALAGAGGGAAGGVLGAEGAQMLEGPAGAVQPLPGTPGALAAALEDENMVDMANIEGQLRASSIRRIAELVEKHPEESLAIVRSWMSQEGS